MEKRNSRCRYVAVVWCLLMVLGFGGKVAFAEPLLGEQSLADREQLTGDWGGERTRLANEGILLNFNHIGDYLTDVSGSQQHHQTFFGRFRASAEVDLRKYSNFPGKFFASAIYQYGRNLSADYLDTFTSTSSIAGHESMRIDQAWYEQGFLNDNLKIKLGQVAAVNEFGATNFFDILMNDELGYAPNAIFSTKQPFSPAGKPGIIFKLDVPSVTPGLYVKGGLFAAYRNPYSPDDTGFNYRDQFNHGASQAFEVGYTDPSKEYAGLYRLGVNRNELNDLYTDLRDGDPVTGDYNIYGIMEKSLYHPKLASGKVDTTKGLDMLLQVIGSPDDRNTLPLTVTAGTRYTGLFDSRPKDKIGAAIIQSQASSHLSDANQAAGKSTLNGETTLELDYQFYVTPWLQIQPDVQAIFNPHGDSDRDNILVLGLRSIVVF